MLVISRIGYFILSCFLVFVTACCPCNFAAASFIGSIGGTSTACTGACKKHAASSICLDMAKKKITSRNKKRRKTKQDHADKENFENALSSATELPNAELANVLEDHRYEQFFYASHSSKQIQQLVDLYERPLLLCNPSLAIEAERDGSTYLLLDRDKRFEFLQHFQEFDLTSPILISHRYPYDAVFVDPPFANVPPSQIAKCLRLMGTKEHRSVPVYIAYTSKREEALRKAFDDGLPCPPLKRLFGLDYKSIRQDMQDTIYLYGPSMV